MVAARQSSVGSGKHDSERKAAEKRRVKEKQDCCNDSPAASSSNANLIENRPPGDDNNSIFQFKMELCKRFSAADAATLRVIASKDDAEEGVVCVLLSDKLSPHRKMQEQRVSRRRAC